MSGVVIGVEPHKHLNAVAVPSAKGNVLVRRRVDNTTEGVKALLALAGKGRAGVGDRGL